MNIPADLVKTLQGDRSAKHSKINVPRLNGGRMGVLATRSPRRQVPIGLSVAQVCMWGVGCRVWSSSTVHINTVKHGNGVSE